MIPVGIDIAKNKIDIFYESRHYTVENKEKELRERFSKLPKESRVVMEATGKYHRLAHSILNEMGIKVMLINPFQSRNFAKAMNVICKTDKVDAKILALFAEKMDFIERKAASRTEQEMQELSRYLDDLKRQRVVLIGQKESAAGCVKESIERLIDSIDNEIKKIELELEKEVDKDEIIAAKKKILLTIPGIGKTTALLLLSNLRELGSLTKNEIVALAGLAPRNNESGTYQGKRYVRGGRSNIRSSLFMPTLGAATMHNDRLKRFYRKLIESGKCKKVALTACMRKLIVWANFLIANNLSWSRDF
jgi:transposase